MADLGMCLTLSFDRCNHTVVFQLYSSITGTSCYLVAGVAAAPAEPAPVAVTAPVRAVSVLTGPQVYENAASVGAYKVEQLLLADPQTPTCLVPRIGGPHGRSQFIGISIFT